MEEVFGQFPLTAPFAEQKHRMGLFIRTIGIARARTRIGMANIAHNLRRLVYWETRTAAA